MDDPWRAVMAAARDTESGAAEIARAAADALLSLDHRVPSAVEAPIRAHPSMAPLWRLGSEALASPDHRDGVRRFVAMLAADSRASKVLAEVLPATVLTISWSSAVIDALKLRRPDVVVCLRSDPGGEGERTAAVLRDAGTDAAVMDDAKAVESLPAEAVAVGADAITPGGVINKIGTRRLAEAAGRAGVPCYVVAGQTKFLALSVPVAGPFEATPLELFTSVATPAGALTPAGARHLVDRYPVDRRLAPLIEELPPGR
ncbi:MAG TPA: hypothetical protein VKA30_00245 [Actinomycetota bacterium]|nr:hypothetical protein [Actinomycetota bacterium]